MVPELMGNAHAQHTADHHLAAAPCRHGSQLTHFCSDSALVKRAQGAE